MHVTVDQEKCCGSGQCVLAAPEVFGQRDEDRIVVLLAPAPAEIHHANVREAADCCPTEAIELS
ncbi:ferredoxin [Nonomuraea endophytica]|uniref:ferredoxin n=1 Tax=Nonomuraea endophytica TaxID=714136 RepID=UPI0037C9C630